jgi:hypothetical protein
VLQREDEVEMSKNVVVVGRCIYKVMEEMVGIY